MRCMKCGSETEANAVFCPRCLEEMEKFPVSMSTPVILPATPKSVAKNTIRIKRPEEEIKTLKNCCRILIVLLILMMIALATVSVLFYKNYQKENKAPIGKNYSTSEETAPPVKGSVSG